MKQSFVKIVFYCFIFSLPLGLRHLISESASVYLSDIFLILFLIYFSARFGWAFGQRLKFLAVFILLSAASILFSVSPALALYSFARLLLLVWLCLTTARALKNSAIKIGEIFGAIAVTSVFQALLATGQFLKQASFGLKWLGEPVISQTMSGVAKTVVNGGQLIRAYGTFPHPNVLSGFLLLGLAALYYFWLRRPSEYKWFSSWRNLFSDLAIGLGIFAVLSGLLFAFSRAAWALAAVLTLTAIIYGIFSKNYFRQGIRLAALSLALLSVFYLNFYSYIHSRARISADEPAVTLRVTYNQMGLYIIKNNPLGVGIGNQVLYSAASGVYEKFGLAESWQKQPIHNIYLLIGSEIGLLGLLTWLLFLAKSLFASRNFFAIAMLSALLIYGLVDHFLWTLQQGQLMLWLVIGIVIGVSGEASPRSISSAPLERTLQRTDT